MIAAQVPNLYFPPVVLVDYLGRRLIVLSILPISKASLVLGSSDAGATVHDSSPEMARMIQQVGEALNLKGHLVEASNGSMFTYGPVDMEGHLGSDGRFYLVDFARLFPPDPR